MIINSEIVEKRFACKSKLALYLIMECKLPVLSYDDHNIYFADTERLRDCLDKMPLLYKIARRLNL